MTLKAYLRILRKRWRTVLILAILGAVAGNVITLLLPPVYSAKTTSFVSITGNGTQPAALYNNSQFALKQVASYTDVVHSPAVLQPVINGLNLHMSTQQLAKQVSATNPANTVLLMVQAQGSSAVQAQAIANGVAQHLGSAIETIETPKAGGPSPVQVKIAVPAALPTAPASPSLSLDVALGVLVGLALGIAIAVLREQLDTTVKSPEELRELSGSPTLGEVGYDAKIDAQPLVALRAHGAGVEDFRSIRTNLQFVDVDRPPRQVVVTSAIAGEGKTLTACNLALTMAQATLDVCLLEADFRRPMVGHYFELTARLGLSDVLAGQCTLDAALVRGGRGQLTVLPAGTMPPDPSHLLGSQAMTDLLGQLRQRFDVLIIDAPPLAVSDAAVLSRASDGAVLVVRHGHTRREQVTRALDDLANVNARLIGTVLTSVPAKEHAARLGDGYGDTAEPDVPEQPEIPEQPGATEPHLPREARDRAPSTGRPTAGKVARLDDPHRPAMADVRYSFDDLQPDDSTLDDAHHSSLGAGG